MFEGDRTMLGTLAWQQVGDVLLLCVAREHASDADLDHWIERLGRHDYGYLLIYARGGGGLSSRQRGRIAEFWKRAPRETPPGAMLTDSQMARYVLTAITWLSGGTIRAFDIHDWGGAFAWMGADCDRGALKVAASRLCAHLDEKQRRSA